MREDLKLCPGCFLQEWAGGPCARCGYQLDLDAFPTALQPGTVLSKYTVGRVLGKPGGFGITYLAFDPVLKRRVALKELMPRELVARRPDGETLRVQTREDEALFKYTLTSFLNEARVIAQFSHPNVVRVLDFFEANGTAYFAMEYYEGETLAEHTQRAGGRLSGDAAVALLLPLLDALDHIHSLEEPILHRDIKPANIYLTGRHVPILLDFGAARVALGQQSRSLSAVLTPGFAPYEQYSTRGNQGPWTDVYGCAATLYFLVTGHAPPEASVRIDDPRVEPPLHYAPDLAQALSDAIVQGLGFKPQDRPQSACEFAALLTGQAEPARTPLVAGGFAPASGFPTQLAAGPDSRDQATRIAPDADSREQATHLAPSSGWAGTPAQRAPGSMADAAQTVLAAAPPPSLRPRRSTRMRSVAAGSALLVVASVAFAVTRQGGSEAEADLALAADSVAPDPEESGEHDAQRISHFRPADDPAEIRPTPTAETPARPVAPEPPPAALPAGASPAPARSAAAPAAADPPPAAAPTAPARGVLVIVYGEPAGDAERAETAILRSLAGRRGLEPLNTQSLSMIRGDQAAVQAANRGDFSALASLGRQHGAEFLVVGNLSSEAVPSGGGFYTGTAEMDLKMYRVSSGRLVEANTFRVGAGGAQAALAISESQARSRAAESAGQAAATGARNWLSRADP